MDIQVECYSGYKAQERPTKITLCGKTLSVNEILDRWYGEDHDYFKVRAEDGHIYVLRYSREEDKWELKMFEHKELAPRYPW